MIDIRNAGENLLKIARKLDSNQDLKKLLHISTSDPLSGADISESLINKNIKVVPLIKEDNNNTENELAIIFSRIERTPNTSYDRIYVRIVLCSPLSGWIINDVSLRPFLIMSIIEKELDGLRVNGLGKFNFESIDLVEVDDQMSLYEMLGVFDQNG